MALALDTVTFTVRDLEAAVHFFCDVLRFAKGRVLDYPHLKTKVVYCESAGGQICLIRDGSRAGRPEADLPPQQLYGYNRCSFSCDDIGHERHRLESLGVRFRSETIDLPGGRKIAFFAGPEGLEFELVEYSEVAWEPVIEEERTPLRIAV